MHDSIESCWPTLSIVHLIDLLVLFCNFAYSRAFLPMQYSGLKKLMPHLAQPLLILDSTYLHLFESDPLPSLAK